MKSLTWISSPGDEYTAMVDSTSLHLKPKPDGSFELIVSKPGVFHRRHYSTIAGPLENAMNVVQGRFLV